MSADKLVTHADLPILRGVRARTSVNDGESLRLLDRLIAAAEADQPPLPEGWVVERHRDGTSRIVWHKDGMTSMWSDGTYEAVTGPGSRLTPLRPTVTEVEVEKAMLAAARAYQTAPPMRNAWDDVARAAFEAAGIEVQS